MKSSERPPAARTAECARRISRRRLLRLGGASAAGVALFGAVGCGRGGENGGASSGIRIKHDSGASGIEAPARRVAAISRETTDLVAALGMGLAGVALYAEGETAGEPLEGRYYVDIGEPVYLGNPEEPSLERLAALEPDLIVMSAYQAGDLYERASQVAPTLAYGILAPGWWRRPLVDVGRATGRENRARVRRGLRRAGLAVARKDGACRGVFAQAGPAVRGGRLLAAVRARRAQRAGGPLRQARLRTRGARRDGDP